LAADPNCIFCRIVAGRAQASVIYRDELACSFMDHRPVNPGHLLVVPNGHASHLSELDEGSGCRMFVVGMRLAEALRTIGLPCEGVNLYLADGAVAGQTVFHSHLHVIPRYDGDGFGLRRWAPPRGQPDRSELDVTAGQLSKALESAGTPTTTKGMDAS